MEIRKDTETEIVMELSDEKVSLVGDLYVPENAQGLILFAHGSGSSRQSPRNRFVAQYLNRGMYATLLFDLLTRSEEAADLVSANLRFDIDLLSSRLSGVTDWVVNNSELNQYGIGYFGASTGAAASLVASVGRKEVKAIVSRGGRADMAGSLLREVAAPTLLIVGGEDHPIIDLNNRALNELGTQAKEVRIVEGATHLFEEPGALDEVARMAVDWFIRYLH
ncbi:dienelactone hydrolase family protein [Chitinispirillales bacterium ANBcel5]|uniref:dienelactone hydrolase family protein n=1 Tax=Cellulosispirillum alkaliphilum TaxID=3039283 RepID=UPI002A527450|nr:dienelactone hydrolase family protein [Chitinispirillales bacterium ANBcel5]